MSDATLFPSFISSEEHENERLSEARFHGSFILVFGRIAHS